MCVHAFPAIIKITALMCNFVADSLCYELAAHSTNTNVYEKYNSDEIEWISQSVITLASVALTPRGEKAPKSLNSMTIIEILKSY